MKLPSRPQDKIIIALDVPDTDGALRLLDSLGETPALCKIGLELFTAEGPSVVKAGLGVAMTTLHASGGPMMMEAAAKAASEEGGRDLLLLAVTVLTSMDTLQLASTGIDVDPEAQVLRLAGLAQQSGISGIVCSPKEIQSARASFGEGLRIVTPGVRPIWAATGDQKRIMTPRDAVQAGADWLVIGRPITAADHPKEAYARVVAELA